MTGYAGSWDYVETTQFPQKTPHIPLKTVPDPSHNSSVRVTFTSNSSQPAENSYERVGVWFSVGYVDRVRSSAESAGSLHNPETRRTPSYVRGETIKWKKKKFPWEGGGADCFLPQLSNTFHLTLRQSEGGGITPTVPVLGGGAKGLFFPNPQTLFHCCVNPEPPSPLDTCWASSEGSPIWSIPKSCLYSCHYYSQCHGNK